MPLLTTGAPSPLLGGHDLRCNSRPATPDTSTGRGVIVLRLTRGARADHAADATLVVPGQRSRLSTGPLPRGTGTGDAVLVGYAGSTDPAAIVAVAERHGAELRAGGPAAAHNAAREHLQTERVACVDQRHHAVAVVARASAATSPTPRVGAVASRIRALEPRGRDALQRYLVAASGVRQTPRSIVGSLMSATFSRFARASPASTARASRHDGYATGQWPMRGLDDRSTLDRSNPLPHPASTHQRRLTLTRDR